MEREIVLDTETTGLDPLAGHRIVEIGCVELVNRLPTGKTFHSYINPERDVPAEAFAVHGLSAEFLSDKPKFNDVAQQLLDFIGDSRLIIHNADFDMKFINHHLFNARRADIGKDRVFCTLIFARRKFPGQQNSLDALCRRFGIDNSHRTKHGALLDSEILAEVYVELMGGKQNIIELERKEKIKTETITEIVKADFEKRTFPVTEEEKELHSKMLGELKDSLWSKITN